MASQISLYTDQSEAIKADGYVCYDESSNPTQDDVREFVKQKKRMVSSFQSAYLEYLKLTSLGVDNITFPYLPLRNSTVNLNGSPVPLRLDNILHSFGLPTFSNRDNSRDLLYDMADTIRQSTPPLSSARSEEVSYYDSVLKIISREVNTLDPFNTSIESINRVSKLFYILNQVDRYGNKVIDGLIDCENLDIRVRTLDLINKLLFYTYKERKVDLEFSKISKPDEIRNDMVYQIYHLRNTNLELYKAFFETPISEELLDYVKHHASKHYNNRRSAKDLIKEGKKEYLRLVTEKMFEQYKSGTLDMDKTKIDLPNSINNSLSKYYTTISKELKNKELDIENLESKLFNDDMSISDMMKFKYFFENYKDNINYNNIKTLFMERFDLKENFQIDRVIYDYFLSISNNIINEKGSIDDIEHFKGLFTGISNKISTNISSSNIGIGVRSPNNYSDILDYIDLKDEDLEGYEHVIYKPLPFLHYIKSRHLHGEDNFTDLLNVKRKMVSSIIKEVVRKNNNFNDARDTLKGYGCGNYVDIMSAILDTPECLQRIDDRFIKGENVFNMSRISQKCKGLKGLGDIIDNDSNIKIMTAIEDVYFSDTGKRAERLPDTESYDTEEHFIIFIPNKGPNEGTSVYFELKNINGNYEMVPVHVYINQRLEYHNYGGKSRTGITVHLNHSSQHLPKDDPDAQFIGSSSSAQSAQLREMFTDNSSISIKRKANKIGGDH